MENVAQLHHIYSSLALGIFFIKEFFFTQNKKNKNHSILHKQNQQL